MDFEDSLKSENYSEKEFELSDIQDNIDKNRMIRNILYALLLMIIIAVGFEIYFAY